MLLYIGPGVGLATILIVVIVVLIVFASLVIVLIRPIRLFIVKMKRFFIRK